MANDLFDDLSASDFKKGLGRAANTISQTYTTVSKDGITVTVTAEPRIVEIQLTEEVDFDQLPERLRENLNQALGESANKILLQAMLELDNA